MHKKPLVWIVVLGALAAFGGLASIYWPSSPEGGADANDPAQVALGKSAYAAQCAACHGAALEGQPNWRDRRPDGKLPAPPHDVSGHTWHHPDIQLFEITKFGTAALAGEDYKTDMGAFADILRDDEIWAVLAYIKSTWPAAVQRRQDAANQRSR